MRWHSGELQACFQMIVTGVFLGRRNGYDVVWNIFMGVLQQIFYMKQFRVVSLSSKGQFIVHEGDGSSRELPIEGFRVTPGVHVRALFGDLLGQTIECTLNKNGTHIRYQNEAFLAKQVAAGAMEVVQKELEESKIYSPAQKARFLAIVPTPSPVGRCVDLTADRRAILKYFPRAETVVGRVEWVGQQLVVSVTRGEEVIFVPLGLKNVNCLFACLEEAAFAPLFLQHPTLNIKIASPIYNVAKRRFELNGELDAKIEEQLLHRGWGLVQGGAVVGANKAEQYLRAEAEAKEQHRGIFSKSTEILGFIYAKNNFVGTVWDVLDGYVVEVARKGTQEKLKIQLAMVRSPVGDQLGAFNSRQFTRKQLIGEEVNVYLHKDSGLNMTGSVVRARDSKDVESLLVEQGWGFVREEFVNSVLCLKLNDLEKRAREKMRGLHSKEVGVFRPEDLTLPNTQKEEFYVYHRLETLKKLCENEAGVLQGLIDTTIYKVWLEEKNIILRVRLEGVLGHNLNPQLEEVKAMKEQLRATYERTMKRRSVIITIIDYQKEGNNFIGTIAFPNGPNLQEMLLTNSYVYADKENSKPAYRALEDKARTGGRGVWSPNLINFEPVNPLALQGERFKGRFSWVEDGQTVFIQPESNYKTLDRIAAELTSAKLVRAVKEQITNGALYAAPYERELYRALVTSVKGKRVKVLFIDWGNRETVEDSSLWELPEPLKLIERQALKAKLALTKPTKNEQYLERIRGELMDGDEYQFRKEGAEYLACYRNKQYMNLLLIERGLVKSNHAKVPEGMRDHLVEIEGSLFRNRVGVWEWSDAEDPSSLDSEDN